MCAKFALVPPALTHECVLSSLPASAQPPSMQLEQSSMRIGTALISAFVLYNGWIWQVDPKVLWTISVDNLAPIAVSLFALASVVDMVLALRRWGKSRYTSYVTNHPRTKMLEKRAAKKAK